MNDLGIFGTSGFAREVADVAAALDYRVIFIARDDAELSAWKFDGEVILESDLVGRTRTPMAIGVGENAVRKRIAERYANDFMFPTLVHPSASFGGNLGNLLKARRGVVVCAGVRLTNNIDIGDFSIFNLNCTVGHDCVIGQFSNVAPGAHISGNVEVHESCWIGTGAVINQGSNAKKLTIGAGTTIGSGAVVTEDCVPNAVYVGVPARRIK